ncbi:hypothetical protein H6P81_002442 [Aristolochia fimbriata]|uniref:FAF domain-containing protein n=1 Tax=Aristolochia fimbriata TaxID=158543 RepID=A0AAV7FAC2_ARIFI|nr:hypothetical protein H6P81_002442 [Aristolochia fimbriata]
MSSRVWQALQSCLEPQGSPWEPKPGEGIYAQPRRSLSARSLELCTENLGCETGSLDFSSSSDDDDDCEEDRSGFDKIRSSSLSPRLGSAPRPSRSWSFNSRRISSDDETARNFPPPLTSISGEDSIRMSSRREGGRLVLKAVNVPSPHAYLQAERSEGRLTLRFLRRPSPQSKPRQAEINVAEKQEEEEASLVAEPQQYNVVRKADVEAEKEEDEEANLEKRPLDTCCDDEKKKPSENNGVCDVGIGEKFKWLTRCKEGGHGNQRFPWEPFWVATS